MGMSKPMVFDGIDDYVSMGDNFDVGTDDWTTVATFEINDKSTGGGDQIIVAKPYSDTDPNKFPGLILIDGEITARVYDGSLFTADYDSTENNVRYQAVAVADRSGNMTLYINGASVATVDISSTDGNSWTVAKNYNVGTVHTADDDWFDGIVYSTSVFRDALSLAQVQELFNDGIEFDLENNTLTGSPTLVGYWRNDGDTTWTDRSTNSNDGTASGSPASIVLTEGLTSGRDSQGFYLTNTDENVLTKDGAGYVEIPDSDVFHLGTKDFTFDFWAKFNEISTTRGFFTYFKDADNRYQLSDYGTIDFFADVGGSDQTAQVSNTRDLDWHHYAIVKESSSLKIYIDTSVVVTNSSWTQDISFTGGTFYLGTRTDDGSDVTSYNVDGYIDEFRIYHDALSSDEVTKNYNAGKSKHS
jgi:hypothetical protein